MLVNVTSNGNASSLLSKGTYNTDWSYIIGQAGSGSGNIVVYITTLPDGGANTVSTTSNLIGTGAWHHVVVAYDGSQSTNTTKVKIYIDGAIQAETSMGTINTSLTDSTAAFYVGEAPSLSWWLGGLLDEVSLFSGTALTADLIATMSNNLLDVGSFETLGTDTVAGGGGGGGATTNGGFLIRRRP
jgi:hypothetical protein